MKNRKRLISLLITLTLCVTIAFAALAEGKLLTIWNAGSKLLFETDNVSLTGHATFTFDGELFKTFDGRYRQDGTKSYMQVMLDTPMEDGTVYTGGYTVVSEDGTVYSMETMRPNIYQTQTTLAEPSILTNTVMRSSLMRFGGLLLDLMEDRMQDAITETATDAGTQYRIALKPGQAPEITDAALTLLLHTIGKEYFFIDLDQELYSTDPIDMAFVEDWDALFAAEYEKAFHEPLPENFYELLWDKNGKATPLQARYEMVNNVINMIIEDAEDAYDVGVALIKEDGSIQYFASYDAYVIAMGFEDLRYENYRQAFRAYYEKKTGDPLTSDEMQAIYASTNGELIDRYIAMATEMEEEHLRQVREGGYSCGLVSKDGTLQGYHNIREVDRLMMLSYMTVTQRILHTVSNVTVDTVDMEVSLDKDGRISSVTGHASFLLDDKYDKQHTLSIAFEGLAFDYGASQVDSFDPAAYNVISAQEFYNGVSVNDVENVTTENNDVTVPQTVVFDGVEYEVYPEGQNG